MNKTKNEIINDGNELMSKSSVAICSIVRNSNKSLIKTIPEIEKLRSKFKESCVIIFENDSIDNTKFTLKKWSENSNNVFVQCENYNQDTIPKKDLNGVNKYFSFDRISKMVIYRNQYLEKLNELNSHYDYLIIIDLDIENFSISGISNSFGMADQWDVVTANGYSYSSSLKKRYHDTYALVEIGKEFESQTEQSIFSNQKKWSFLRPGIPMIPVYSAYGGLAIYRYNLIKNKKYEVLDNFDSRVAVRCEHFSLHKLIHNKGNVRFFINPEMGVFYEKITFSKIKKSLLNFFSP
jgi:hypothetical protein